MSRSKRTHRLILTGAICFALASLSFVAAACGTEEAATEATTPTVEQTKAAPELAASSTPAQERQWAFRGQRGITAAFAPADLDLYRSLLAAQFDMPESPLVAVSVVNYYNVTLPLTPYSEGYVVLQCRYQGRTGWYVLTMPVNDEIANAGGRALGFPKYVADEIDLEETEGVWNGSVIYQGRDVMRVTFTPDAGAEPVENSSADPGLPVFLLVPPAEGPQVNEVNTDIAGERRTVTTAGTITIEADPGEAWAGLLPEAGTAVWGSLDEMTGEWVLTGAQP
jgi:acetoacetate decarboxylase